MADETPVARLSTRPRGRTAHLPPRQRPWLDAARSVGRAWVLAAVLAAGASAPARAAEPVPPPSEVPDAPRAPHSDVPREGPGTWAVVGVTSALTLSVLAGGFAAWWRDAGVDQRFSLKHSGMFGRHTYAGGSDKLGHAYASYAATRIISGVYGMLGFAPRPRLFLGTMTSFLLGNLIEVVDGFSPYKFEYGDVVANCVGIALGALQETVPAVEAMVGFRLGYVPSPGFLRGKKSYLKLVNDYAGMLFFLDLKPAGLSETWSVPVGPARYALLGVFYGTTGYRPRKDVRRRHLGVFVGLNVPEILRSLFGDERASVRAAGTVTRYVALPGTVAGVMRDLNHRMTHLNVGVSPR